jgi:hypothetical protein
MAPVIAALVKGTALALIGLVIACIGYRKLKKSIFKTSFAGENVRTASFISSASSW